MRWLILFAYAAFITWASLAPAETFAGWIPPIPHIDKLIHFCFYGGMVTLGRWTLAAHWSFRLTFRVVVFGAIGYGALMEILQGLLVSYHRTFEFGDIVANSLGAFCFWGLSRFLFQRSAAPPGTEGDSHEAKG